MMRLLSRLIFGATLWVVGVHAQSGPVMRSERADEKMPRVVLLVDDADLEALVIAGFDGAETLGRAELPKVAAERLLAGGRLELNGADIALVVERMEQRGVVKIVDCSTGAMVVALELPKMPVAETACWIVARTRTYLDATADTTRLRISLTGLRFVTDSAENRSAERALNLMLAARLQARGAVVLERWRMGDVVFEKSIHANESPFWRAAQIVDGSVTAAGGRLQARVRIRDAAGAEAFVESEGGTAGELADDVVARVLAGRGAAAAAGAGAKTGTEATAFLAEARWMLAHGLPREAWQATESALALGVEPRREAEMLRVKAAAMCAYPDDLKNIGYARDSGYRPKAFELSELPARVSAATEAMLLAGDYWNAYPAKSLPEGSDLVHPAILGVHSLYTGLRVLRTASDCGWVDANGEAIRGLRAAIRRNVALMRGALQGKSRWVFFQYVSIYAGYWSETPAEAVAFYRMVLDPGFDAGLPAWPEVIRRELAHGVFLDDAIPRPPLLNGTASPKDFPRGVGPWRVPSPHGETARAVWSAFIDELDRSPLVLHQADGLALRWQSTADIRARRALTVRIADFVSAHAEELAGPQGSAIFVQLVEPLREANRAVELVSVQEKIVGLYLSLIRSEREVSPLIIAYIPMLFSQGGGNVREEQGRALLAALDDRSARPGISRGELSGIDGARASIRKKFPALDATMINAGDALVVRSLWIAGEHGPEAVRKPVGFDGDAGIWSDGSLWVPGKGEAWLWKIDPQGAEAMVISPENRPKTDSDTQLVAWGARFAITAEEGVWVLDENRTRWRKLDLPGARYQMGVVHGDLWVAAGELTRVSSSKQTEGTILYRIAPALTCELVASSRRRPAVHPLDSVLAGAPFSVSASRSGGVMIGMHAGNWNWVFHDSAGGTDAPGQLNDRGVENMKITGSPGLIIRRKYPNGDRLRPIRIELLDAANDELLLAHPDLDRSGRARFRYPKAFADLPVSEYAAVWRDDGIDIFAWDRSSPRKAAEAWLVRIDADGGAVHPLRFEWSAETEQRVHAAGRGSAGFRHPRPGAKGLIATDQGLVITGAAMGGFWFIPKEDLDRRRSTVVVAPPQR